METKPAIVLACDIDRTLVAGMYESEAHERPEADQALYELHQTIDSIKREADFPFFFGTVTGRTMPSHEKLEQFENPIFGDLMAAQADFKITGVGSRISLREPDGSFPYLSDWPTAPYWDGELARSTLEKRLELDPQDITAQDDFKVSFYVEGVDERYHSSYVANIQDHLGRAGIQATVIFSGGQYLDILPLNTNKGTALRHTMGELAIRYGLSHIITIGAGDSMNDADLLAAADIGILPDNADETLLTWVDAQPSQHKFYKADARFAAGVHEGLYWYMNSLN